MANPARDILQAVRFQVVNAGQAVDFSDDMPCGVAWNANTDFTFVAWDDNTNGGQGTPAPLRMTPQVIHPIIVKSIPSSNATQVAVFWNTLQG